MTTYFCTEALPLIALHSKQSELSKLTNVKALSIKLSKKSDSASNGHSQVCSQIEHSSKFVQNGLKMQYVSVVLTPLVELPATNCVSAKEFHNYHRRRSISIMGAFSPKCSSFNEKSISVESVSNNALMCSLCKLHTFSSKNNLLEHMVQCGQQDCNKIEKSHFLYQLGLVSVKASSEYDKVVQLATADSSAIKRSQPCSDISTFLSKFPISSSLSRKLFFNDLVGKVENFAFFNPDLFKNECHSKTINDRDENVKIFPVVYKPPRSKLHSHIYSITNAERRKRATELKIGEISKESLKLLKQCKPCVVKVEKLPDSTIPKLHTRLRSSTVTRTKPAVVSTKVLHSNHLFVNWKTVKRDGNRLPNGFNQKKCQKSVTAFKVTLQKKGKQWKNVKLPYMNKFQLKKPDNLVMKPSTTKVINLNGISVTASSLNFPEVRVVISANPLCVNEYANRKPRKLNILRVKGPAVLHVQTERSKLSGLESFNMADAPTIESQKSPNAGNVLSKMSNSGALSNGLKVFSPLKPDVPNLNNLRAGKDLIGNEKSILIQQFGKSTQHDHSLYSSSRSTSLSHKNAVVNNSDQSATATCSNFYSSNESADLPPDAMLLKNGSQSLIGKALRQIRGPFDGTKFNCVMFKCHLCGHKYVFHEEGFKYIDLHLNTIHPGKLFYLNSSNSSNSPMINRPFEQLIEAFAML